ncbi:MAG: type III polyketide synthase [Pseudomonadota bacterium]
MKGLARALPPHLIPQDVAAHRAQDIFAKTYPDFARLSSSFHTAGIDQRYSVVPLEWFDEDHDWPDRTRMYLEGATRLFIDAAQAALEDAGVEASKVDTVVTVSSTGIATPTLEARAFQHMGFRTDVKRVPVFGLGCAGGVSGLSIARSLAKAEPGSTVLLVVVEACTLSFRADRLTKADIIASVLFGDGAAACCLSADDGAGPRIGQGFEHTWPDTLSIMGWDVDTDGFGVVFDRSIPAFARKELGTAVDNALSRFALAKDDVHRFICHPGGAKVVDALEHVLDLDGGSLDHEREVLRRYGNMSAPTVLFVLDNALRSGVSGPCVLMALGPGFTFSAIPLLGD